MIFVLRKSGDYNDTYFVEEYETKEQVINAMNDHYGYYLTDFQFIEGQRLKISLSDLETAKIIVNN